MNSTGDRVLLLSFDYPPNDGGIARFCEALTAVLRRRGLPTKVVAQQAAPDQQGLISSDGVERIPGSRWIRDLRALRRLWQTSGPNTYVAGIWYPEGLIAALAGVRPLVILAHGSELMPAPERWRRGMWGLLCRWVMTRADLVVANSTYTQRLVDEIAPGSRSVGIPLGVDTDRFRPADRARAKLALGVENRIVLSTVARLVAYKGHEVVLRALGSLGPSVRDRFVFLIAGDGPDRPRLQELAVELGVDSAIRWLGLVAESELTRVYQASDLFVLCTRENRQRREVEGFGLAFLEAQACGVPVVGTRTGGIPDAIKEGEGGWLIDQDDVAGLRSILERLPEEPELFVNAGRLARQRVEREGTWDRFVDTFLQELAARRPVSS